MGWFGASVAAVAGAILSMVGGRGSEGRRLLFRVLVPSWRFFSDPEDEPTLWVLGGKRPVLLFRRVRRGPFALLWNPEGSADLFQRSWVEQAIEEDGDGRNLDTPSVEAILRLAQGRVGPGERVRAVVVLGPDGVELRRWTTPEAPEEKR